HVLTTEGGIFEEEYRVEYVADRVHTTATVFMGLTLQCARCHDHKFDPFTQREYYQLFAFFNNLPEKVVNYGKGGIGEPFIKVPTPAEHARLDALRQRLAGLQRRLLRQGTAGDAARLAAAGTGYRLLLGPILAVEKEINELDKTL